MTIAMAGAKFLAHYVKCADCKGWFDPTTDRAFTVPDGLDEKTICPNCAEERYNLAVCEDCDEVFDQGDLLEVYEYIRTGDCSWRGVRRIYSTVCEDCAEDRGYTRCNNCGDWLHTDEQRIGADGDSYCDDCFCERFNICENCGEVRYEEDCRVYEGSIYCEDCCPSCEDENDYSYNFHAASFRNRSGRTTGIGSERCYGLELETDDCDGYHSLEGRVSWGAKCDPTCNGKEFYSAILDGDEGLAEIIKLTDFADENGWEVGSRCGYHLHIDMRQENDDSLFAVAYAYRATQELWHSFVDSHRHNNTYCHTPCWGLRDIAGYDGTFLNFLRDVCRDRYEWVNLTAYDRHATFEIRLHHASLDKDEVCNWVKAHTRFVDWAATNGLDAVMNKVANLDDSELFDLIAREAWQDTELRDYYTEKAGGVCCAA